MNTQENNKLIAEFMGGQYVDEYLIEFEDFYAVKEIVEDEYYYTNCFDSDNELQYHTSWVWLMPVVEKIECTTIDNNDNSDSFFNVMIEVFECNINGGYICICKSGHTKRDATYQAVVEFINQYNKTK